MADWLTWLQLALSCALFGVIGERLRYLLYLAPLSADGLKFVLRALEGGRFDSAAIWASRAPRTHVGALLGVAHAEIARAHVPHTDLARADVPHADLARADVPRADLARDDADDSVAEALFDLEARAVQRLRLLRVGATVASTLGLLVGILRIRGGFGEPAGLLALEAGLPERLALSAALFSMAVGVGTSAVCFFALSTLREAARVLIAQGTRVVNVLDGPKGRRAP